MSHLPSIFNDVIGPVMRGPSSSHCAASVRIGRLARDLMAGRFDRVLIEFHPAGSLATTSLGAQPSLPHRADIERLMRGQADARRVSTL